MKSGVGNNSGRISSQARRAWVEQPPVLIEVSEAQIREVERHVLDGLPEGVELAPGSITVRFHEPDEALQKLMALAMAISQNRLALTSGWRFDWRPRQPQEARHVL
jgi:hypothetical protein